MSDAVMVGPALVSSISAPSDETFYQGGRVTRLEATLYGGGVRDIYPGVTLGLTVTPEILPSIGSQDIHIKYGVDNPFADDIDTVETITVVGDTPVSASFYAKAINRVYYVGDIARRAGTILKVEYESGKSTLIGSGSLTISPAVFDTAGEIDTTYTYTENGVSVSVVDTVTVLENPITQLVVMVYPKTEYKIGDSFDSEGADIMAVYESGKREDVTSSVTYSPDTITDTTTEVPASYDGVSIDIPITLIAPVSIEISGLAESYAVGDTVTGITATATYPDGETASLVYTINGVETDSYEVTAEDIQIVVVAEELDVRVEATAEVTE